MEQTWHEVTRTSANNPSFSDKRRLSEFTKENELYDDRNSNPLLGSDTEVKCILISKYFGDFDSIWMSTCDLSKLVFFFGGTFPMDPSKLPHILGENFQRSSAK